MSYDRTVSDAIPITVLIPDSIGAPIEVVATHTALRMAIVERKGVHRLGEEREAPCSWYGARGGSWIGGARCR